MLARAQLSYGLIIPGMRKRTAVKLRHSSVCFQRAFEVLCILLQESQPLHQEAVLAVLGVGAGGGWCASPHDGAHANMAEIDGGRRLHPRIRRKVTTNGLLCEFTSSRCDFRVRICRSFFGSIYGIAMMPKRSSVPTRFVLGRYCLCRFNLGLVDEMELSTRRSVSK